jgi:2-C-methyl-D-erythritol 4-phosphate cytidylyltransferase
LRKRTFTLIIAAAGEGRRLGADTAKAFVDLGGVPMLIRTLERFDGIPRIAETVVAVRPGDTEQAQACLADREATVVEGGDRRQDSVRAALSAAASEYVAVHDAARPFVTRELIEKVLDETAEHDAAIAATPVTDTIKQADAGSILRTVPREDLWAAQTPQAFRTDILRNAFEKAGGVTAVTDDAQLVEALGIPVRIVAAGPENFKITTPEDLERARALLG